jgi:transcriptional regulator with XRE-family HTH domain
LARTSNFADAIRRELAQDQALAQAVEEAASEADIAAELFAMRAAAGLTQSQLAKLVGTQQSVIARLEDADYTAHSLTMLRKIAWALGRTVRVQFPPIITQSAVPDESKNEQICIDVESFLAFGHAPEEIDDTDFEQIHSEGLKVSPIECGQNQ